MKRKKAKKNLEQSKVQNPESIKRLKARWMMAAICGGIGVVLFIVIFSIMMQMPRALTKNDVSFLSNYEQVRVALAADNLKGAKAAARPISTESEPFGSAATRLMASGTLDSARNEFKVLSDHAVMLARNQPGFFTMQCTPPCPMHCVQCPMEHFGKWVQQTPQVTNPYMGSAGLGCGRISDL